MTMKCEEWSDDPREPQEVCPSCGHFSLWHDEYGCGKCQNFAEPATASNNTASLTTSEVT